MTINLEKRRLVLTHKRSLVHTSLPILTDYQQVSLGMQVEGTVTQVIPAGLLVAFYNNVRVSIFTLITSLAKEVMFLVA